MADNQYITNYSGPQIDAAVSAFMQTKYARRSILSHTIASDVWQATDNGYYIDIQLSGIYALGEYPVIYFLDASGNRYELDYMMLERDSAAPYIRIQSNIKIAGRLVEITNISSDPTQPSNPMQP